MSRHTTFVRNFLAASLTGSLALAPTLAQADFSSGVTVRLLAPGGTTAGGSDPIDVLQALALDALGTGVLAPNLGGSGDVSASMLDDERVFFDVAAQSILLRVGVGDDTNGVYTTGYLGNGSDHARYQIDGLSVAGEFITGFAVYAFDGFATSGGSGLASPQPASVLVKLVDADSVSFDLDSLVFAQRTPGSSSNYAEFRIDVLTSPVPEPASALLLLLGISLVGLRRRTLQRA